MPELLCSALPRHAMLWRCTLLLHGIIIVVVLLLLLPRCRLHASRGGAHAPRGGRGEWIARWPHAVGRGEHVARVGRPARVREAPPARRVRSQASPTPLSSPGDGHALRL